MATRGMDLCCFARDLLSGKQPVSIPRVTIFLLIDMPRWILCLQWHKTIHYVQPINLFVQPPAKADQRKVPPSPLMLSSLLHHADGQQPFRTIFAHQTQWNFCESYAILKIDPLTEISVRHCRCACDGPNEQRLQWLVKGDMNVWLMSNMLNYWPLAFYFVTRQSHCSYISFCRNNFHGYKSSLVTENNALKKNIPTKSSLNGYCILSCKGTPSSKYPPWFIHTLLKISSWFSISRKSLPPPTFSSSPIVRWP